MKLCPNTKDGPLLNGRKLKYKRKDGTVGERLLNINDLTLKVNPQKGKVLEKDISCDSAFMLDHIRDIGKSIREAYSFLDQNIPVYLFIDNAGGHGKTDVKLQYQKILQDDFNILIEWQVPNSPETNMLDLGVWVALQSLVEKIHKGKVTQSDILAQSVEEAFHLILSEILDKVHSRWKLVIQLLVSGKGTNEVVEEHRGLKPKAMLEDLPGVPDCKEARGYISSEDECSSDEEEGGESMEKETEMDDALRVEKDYNKT